MIYTVGKPLKSRTFGPISLPLFNNIVSRRNFDFGSLEILDVVEESNLLKI